ncbi:hypothetical protein BC826DRAFT_102155 [Russula brevipes]|nr:hypothetical protein BC826DRAFT_102155 [Russula brevipes]
MGAIVGPGRGEARPVRHRPRRSAKLSAQLVTGHLLCACTLARPYAVGMPAPRTPKRVARTHTRSHPTSTFCPIKSLSRAMLLVDEPALPNRPCAACQPIVTQSCAEERREHLMDCVLPRITCMVTTASLRRVSRAIEVRRSVQVMAWLCPTAEILRHFHFLDFRDTRGSCTYDLEHAQVRQRLDMTQHESMAGISGHRGVLVKSCG